jgi:hypothetical protein
MPTPEEIKAVLLHELEALHAARDELLLEGQIDHTDVHLQWDRIDSALQFARAEINRLGDDSELAASEIEEVSRKLLDEVRNRVEGLRQRTRY